MKYDISKPNLMINDLNGLYFILFIHVDAEISPLECSVFFEGELYYQLEIVTKRHCKVYKLLLIKKFLAMIHF